MQKARPIDGGARGLSGGEMKADAATMMGSAISKDRGEAGHGQRGDTGGVAEAH
jgi:hypothetical protein